MLMRLPNGRRPSSSAADGWWLTLVPISRTYSARQGEPIRYDGRTRHAIQDWSKLPVLGSRRPTRSRTPRGSIAAAG